MTGSLHYIYFTTIFKTMNIYFFFTGREIAGSVTLKHIYEIAQVKKTDKVFQNTSLENVCKAIIGSARSMGIEILDGKTEEKTKDWTIDMSYTFMKLRKLWWEEDKKKASSWRKLDTKTCLKSTKIA